MCKERHVQIMCKDRHRLDKNKKEGYPKERDQHVQRKACAKNQHVHERWEKARREVIKESQWNTGKQGKDTSFVHTLRAMAVKETI